MIHQTSMTAKRPIQSQPIARQLAGSGVCGDGITPCNVADDIAKVTNSVAPLLGPILGSLI